jgi:pyruvate dehydrogenase E1 component beta subunit
MKKTVTFNKAINIALHGLMQNSDDVIILGEGITDPGRIFGTTNMLLENYGKDRVIESQIAENSTTGIALGLALKDKIPILIHQRCDFSLYSFDQLINNIAKWGDMFGHQHKFTVIIRMIIGQGWGQGQQHAQNLQATLAHFPGIMVYAPCSPFAVYNLLHQIKDIQGCHIILEHRWCQQLTQSINRASIDLSTVKVEHGNSLTIVANSYPLIEVLRLNEFYKKQKTDITLDIINLRSLTNINFKEIIDSAQRTKQLLVIENDWAIGGIASYIISEVAINTTGITYKRLSHAHHYPSSSKQKSDNFFINIKMIHNMVEDMLNRKIDITQLEEYMANRTWDKPDYVNIPTLPNL